MICSSTSSQLMPMRHRVLAIDDSPEILDTIRAALGSDFQMLATVNALQGLNIAEQQRPDLILLDVVMAGMDGYELCRRLKANPQTEEIPVIFVTGLGSHGDELRGFAVGAVDFVTKPIEPVTLRARVRSHVELGMARRALCEANMQMAQEREIIAEIIVSMRNDDDFHTARLAWKTHSQDAAGGDLVLSARRPSGDEHVLIGDFTGHGLSAAIGTPLVSHMFYSMTKDDRPLSTILREINNVLARRLPLRCFMAAAAVCIPADQRAAQVWGFGNPDLLHHAANGQWTRLASAEMPMGIDVTNTDYPSQPISMGADECLFLMTDGPLEASHQDGAMYGVNGIIDALERHDLDVERVIDEIVAQAPQADALDDLTLIRIGGHNPGKGDTP